MDEVPVFAVTLTAALGILLVVQGLGALERPTDPRLGATPPPPRWHLGGWLARAGLPDLSPRRFLLLSAGSGVVGLVIGWEALGWVVAAVAAAAAGLWLPAAVVSWRLDRRQAAMGDAVAELVGRLRDALRAGSSLPEALTGLAATGPALLRPELARLARDIRLSGLQPALRRSRDRLADPVVDLLTITLAINDRIGGRGISDVLDRLAHAVQAEALVTAEARAYQARNRTSARVLAVIPVVLLVAIRALNPRYTAVFDTSIGQGVLLGCAILIVAGYLVMRRIAQLPGDGRLFR